MPTDGRGLLRVGDHLSTTNLGGRRCRSFDCEMGGPRRVGWASSFNELGQARDDGCCDGSVASGGRVELVRAEHRVGMGVELRAEQVGQRDGASTGFDDGDGLRCGQRATPASRNPLERVWDWPNRAEVWAGADDHLYVGRVELSDRVGEQRDGTSGRDSVRDVVRAHHDDRDVRLAKGAT